MRDLIESELYETLAGVLPSASKTPSEFELVEADIA